MVLSVCKTLGAHGVNRSVTHTQKFGFIKGVDKRLNYHRESFRKLTFRALAFLSDKELTLETSAF